MHTVILGAGFGGLRLARKLKNKKGVSVTLIDRFNYHQFQPLFYQVATAGLDASNISFPIRKIFHKAKNIRILLAQIEELRIADKTVITDSGPIVYDKLVIALGADTNFFGNAGLEAHAFPMKSTVEALQLRHRLLQNFEEATRLIGQGRDEAGLEKYMNIIVAGAGPTGVELSGAIAEMRRWQLPNDFPELDFSRMKIILVEGTSKVLGAMSAKSSTHAQSYLERLGVIVKTSLLVSDYDGHWVTLNDGSRIESALVIWAAGIRGNIPAGIQPDLIARGNRIRVDRQCRVLHETDVWGIGDIAWMEEEAWPQGHPQVAPVAIQQADHLAAQLLDLAHNRKSVSRDFAYKNQGAMATVGRNLAVVDVPSPQLFIKGFMAWLIWMSLHLMLILGVKNRFFVFVNWLYNYITYDQNLRLIFRDFDREKIVAEKKYSG